MDIRKNPNTSRYELMVGDDVAGWIDYIERPDGVLDLPHTVVEPQHANQGYAGELVKHVLDEARASSTKVIPTCPYIARYIERRPELHDLRA